jgi:hypothetical protein
MKVLLVLMLLLIMLVMVLMTQILLKLLVLHMLLVLVLEMLLVLMLRKHPLRSLQHEKAPGQSDVAPPTPKWGSEGRGS